MNTTWKCALVIDAKSMLPGNKKCPMTSGRTQRDTSRYLVRNMGHPSLLPRPVRAIRVTRGGLEPSVIARVLGEFSRQVWQVTSHPKSPRTVGNVAGGIRFCSWLNPRARLDYKLASRELYFNFISNELKEGKLKTVKRFCSSFFGFRLNPEM